jgi:uncharacterized protein
MNQKLLIKKTEEFVKKTMKGDPGHDWSHVNRVRNLAVYIGKKEKANLLVVELAALLHDVADYKFHKGNDKVGGQLARQWLSKNKLDQNVVDHIVYIIDNVSFKGAGVKYDMKTLEGKIVQDADKLDALGAIGIARAFSFGGLFNRPMFDSNIKPVMHDSFSKYKNGKATTINHFYEKLLLLKDRMHTKTARQIAKHRHKFMQKYLEEFYKEWNS